jgi:hypothetical protein
MKNYLIEIMRPWKLITFLIGLALLIYGAITLNFPDWDVPISIIMTFLTYLTAPMVVNVLISSLRRENKYPIIYSFLALIIAFFVIDSSYVIYNSFFNHLYFRRENFIVSTCLYFMCGFLWRYNGTMKELFNLVSFRKYDE